MRSTPPPFRQASTAPRFFQPVSLAVASLFALFLHSGCGPKSTDKLVEAALESDSRDARITAVQRLFDDEGLLRVLRSTEEQSLEDLAAAKLGQHRLLRRVHEIIDHDLDRGALVEAEKLFFLARRVPGAMSTSEQAYLALCLGIRLEQSSKLPEACAYYQLAAEAGDRAAAIRLARIEQENPKQYLIKAEEVADLLQKAGEAGSREALIEGQGRILQKGVFTSDAGPLAFRYDSPPETVARAKSSLQELAQAGDREAQFRVGRDLLHQHEDQARAVAFVRRSAVAGNADAAQCLALVENDETDALQPLEQRYWKSFVAAIESPNQNNDPYPASEPAEPVWTLGYGGRDKTEEIEIAKIVVIPAAANPAGQKAAFVALAQGALILCDDKETRPALGIIADAPLLDRCLRSVGQQKVLLLCPAEALETRFALEESIREAAERLCMALSPDGKTTGGRFRAPELAGPEHRWDSDSLSDVLEAKHRKGEL